MLLCCPATESAHDSLIPRLSPVGTDAGGLTPATAAAVASAYWMTICVGRVMWCLLSGAIRCACVRCCIASSKAASPWITRPLLHAHRLLCHGPQHGVAHPLPRRATHDARWRIVRRLRQRRSRGTRRALAPRALAVCTFFIKFCRQPTVLVEVHCPKSSKSVGPLISFALSLGNAD